MESRNKILMNYLQGGSGGAGVEKGPVDTVGEGAVG